MSAINFLYVGSESYRAIVQGEQKAILSIGIAHVGDYLKLKEVREDAFTGCSVVIRVTHSFSFKSYTTGLERTVYSFDVMHWNAS